MKTEEKRNNFFGITLLEMLVSLMILSIISGGAVALWDNFGRSRDVEIAAQNLYYDLGLAGKFARSLRNGYSYYGVRFYNNTGSDGKLYGYKILLFCNATCSQDPPSLPINGTTNFRVIKSNNATDTPEFLENTSFTKGVIINSTSELKVNDTVIFTAQGSATSDGLNLLNSTKDTITLSRGTTKNTLKIYNMTGLVEKLTP